MMDITGTIKKMSYADGYRAGYDTGYDAGYEAGFQAGEKASRDFLKQVLSYLTSKGTPERIQDFILDENYQKEILEEMKQSLH